ncbi:MAG: LysE family transporter [Pseudomonadota bacterium]
MTIETYLAYLATVLIFFAHPPGPSQMLFVAGAMRHGLRRATPILAGDLSANGLQIIAAGFGLAGLIAASATAFAAIKWAGIAYLLWVGLRIILDARRGSATREAPNRGQLFRRGFLTSAANPYAVVFFAALFPQFLDPALPLIPQIAILGITYIVIDGAILLLMGGAAERISRALGGAFERWLGYASGAGLIAAAAALALRGLPEPERSP